MKKHSIGRLLCCVLCLALACGLMAFAAAAEAEELDLAVLPGASQPQARSIGTNSAGEITFTTFAELQQLVGNSANAGKTLTYTGSGSLTISADLSLDSIAVLKAENAEVIIPAGVKVTNNSAELYTKKLTVKGTLVNNYYVYAHQNLTVTGSIENSSQVDVDGDCTVTGKDKISIVGYNYYLSRSHIAANTADIKAAIAAANAETDSKWTHFVYIDSSQQLTESVTLPANAIMWLYADSFTVNKGVTLTLRGSAYLYGCMEVKGSLVNNRYINMYESGKLNVASGGSYSGTGKLYIRGIQTQDVASRLPWLDQDDYFLSMDGSWVMIQPRGDMVRLPTPTDLRWGYVIESIWGSNIKVQPGGICFKPGSRDAESIVVKIYKVGQTEVVHTSYLPLYENFEYCSTEDFIFQVAENGTYYYTAQLLGDGTNTYDSEVAVSDTWTYVKPNKKLADCTNVAWNWPIADWDSQPNQHCMGGYQLTFYYTPSLDQAPYHITDHYLHMETTEAELGDWEREFYGKGYYCFRVRAFSEDIAEIAHGDWSEMSELYYMGQNYVTAEQRLQELLAASATLSAAQIRQEVQKIDSQELKRTLEDDWQFENAFADFVALEEAVGGPAAVTSAVAAFPKDKTAVYGANFNDSVNGKPITLTIGAPSKINPIPETYEADLAIHFSMKLENAGEPKQWESPVRVKLPVPVPLNFSFTEILYYHPDGTVEAIVPEFDTSDGAFYGYFFLPGNGDFVMTERISFASGYANMTLGNSLAMNFAFPQDAYPDWTGCTVHISKNYGDGRGDAVKDIPQSQWRQTSIGGKPYWLVTFPGVAAKEMTDKVFVTVQDPRGLSLNGPWYDSVQAYAMRLLNNASTNRETMIMAVDLLNYGTAAQEYFSYNTQNLANSQLTSYQQSLATQYASAKDSRTSTAKYLGTNLGLESQILMRMAFTGVTGDMYAKIEFTNHAGRKISETVPGSDIVKGVIVIDEAVIADGRRPITITVYNADGSVYASATDSMEAYIARMREKEADPLFEAILKFSDSAYNFFH